MIPLRQPRREAVLQHHGLLTSGEADVNQGMLFEPKHYGEQSLDELASSRGLPPPLPSSRGGWLPGIEASPGGRKSASERKIDAVKSFSRIRESSPFPGGETAQELDPVSPQAHHMRSLIDLHQRSPQNTNWYGSYDKGSVGPGEATEGIARAAQRTGTSPVEMTRAVAVTSPQMPWTAGNKLYQTHPNIETAESVADTLHSEIRESGRRSFSENEIETMGKNAPGQGMNLGKGRAALAFGVGGETAQPVRAGEGYGKVPNFNEANLVGNQDVPRRLRAAYAGSYTSDVWDLTGKGLDPEGFHRTQGMYEVDKMLSTRAAFKQRVLPPQMQESTWTTTRGEHAPEPLTASVNVAQPHEAPKYRNFPSLFHDEHGGNLQPSFNLRGRAARETPARRSPRAEKFGLEF